MNRFLKILALLGLCLMLAGGVLGAWLVGAYKTELFEDVSWENWGGRLTVFQNREKSWGEEDMTYQVPEEKQDGITALDFSFTAGEIQIREGSNLSVEATGLVEGALQCETDGRTWYIRDTARKSQMPHSYCPQIIITVPSETKFRAVTIRAGAGTVTTETILTEAVSVEIGAGSVQISRLEADEATVFQVGAGELSVENYEGKNILLENGVGTVYIKGRILGHNQIKCGIGSVELTLVDMDQIEYGYSVDCAIGEVMIGSRIFSGTADYNLGSDVFFDLSCNIGTIELK